MSQKPIGFVYFAQKKDNFAIEELDVAKKHQGQGIGRRARQMREKNSYLTSGYLIVVVVALSALKKIEIKPIGFVRRTSSDENVRDKSLVSKIMLKKNLVKALDGVEEFSHVFIIYWMHKISNAQRRSVHSEGRAETPSVGVLACRGPIRPNPIGLTLVELVKREENVLWVRGLDALDRTPVLDIKPYGRPSDIATNFRVPKRFCEK